MSVFAMHAMLSLVAALTAASPSPAAPRLSGLEFLEGVRGCPFMDRTGATFACLESRPSPTGTDVTVAFVGLDGKAQERVPVYRGPAAARAMFVLRSGVRKVNQRLVKEGFTELRRLDPKALRVVDGAVVRTDGSLFRFGSDRPVRRWQAPALNPWSACRGAWAVDGAAADPKDGSRRFIVSLRALAHPGLKPGSSCATTSSPDPAADVPYAYMVMAASGAQVRVSVPALVKPLDAMCRRVLQCVAQLKGTPADPALVTRLRGARRASCVRTLAQFRRDLGRSGVTQLPTACH